MLNFPILIWYSSLLLNLEISFICFLWVDLLYFRTILVWGWQNAYLLLWQNILLGLVVLWQNIELGFNWTVTKYQVGVIWAVTKHRVGIGWAVTKYQVGVGWVVTKYWVGVGWAVTKYWVGLLTLQRGLPGCLVI